MSRFILAAFIAVHCASSAQARENRCDHDKGTVQIADFETDESVAKWTGLAVERTNEHASRGKFGMRFGIPACDEKRGDEPRPGVRLLFNEGAGYRAKDWSSYGAVVVDVWVEGDSPGRMGLKLRDGTGTDSWTTHIDVEPGKVNQALLRIDDAAADINVRDIREVVLYSLRPKSAFTLIVDNLRLLPREDVSVAEFCLDYPNYRGLVFPGAGDITVSANVNAERHGLKRRQLELRLCAETGTRKMSSKHSVPNALEVLSISQEGMEEGPVTLRASLLRKRTDEVLAEREWELRKIGRDEMAGMKVYIDRFNNTIVDGKPFFPLGFYNSMNPQYLDELIDSPFNTYLVYGTNRVPKKEMRAYLDKLDENGRKLIYCMNDVYPSARYLDGVDWEGVTGNDAIAGAVVAEYKAHPAILAWYLNDEIPVELEPELDDYYKRMKSADPDHPCFIVLCNRKDLAPLQHTTDILAGDPYPIPKEPVTRVTSMMDKCNEAVRGAKPIWLVPQAFAWYQHTSENKDRSHIPTEKELETGRAPTYEEGRCMTYLGLVRGAKGLVYWCYYNMRVLPQYEEMWTWMKDIGEEVKALSPMLLSPDDIGEVEFEPADAMIETKLKRHDGRLYLMAVNASKEVREVRFRFADELPDEVDVMFENTTASTDGRYMNAHFEPLEVHVYDLGRSGD